MSDEHKWERVDDDSPLRCQAMTQRGQCNNKKQGVSKFCPAHGGNRANMTAKNEQRRIYAVEKLQQQLSHFEDHPKTKSLSGEIAVLRMILQSKLQKCNDEHDLAIHSTTIIPLVTAIEKLVTSCDRLDTKLGNMLDPTQAIQWMEMISDLVAQYITDPDDLNEFNSQLIDSYTQIAGVKNSVPKEDA